MAIPSIPERCTVLVIGGGPGGSYAAAVLARENIDTVVLEAEKVPRYHIGESMLPSFRHYLKFVDLHSKFDNHGFTIKNGAAFKMSPENREGFTDFRAPNEDNRAWNVIRSEADEIMFRHAEECGAKVFDGIKVSSLDFEPCDVRLKGEPTLPDLGRPVQANWSSKANGGSGTIKFDYLVDASGRAGVLSTKYLKNRHYSKALKNVANWAYFSGAGMYGKDSNRAGVPFFEALRDESGWAWFIPLHNGTHSIGVVMNQDIATKKKSAETCASPQQFFEDSLKLSPMLLELLGPDAKQVSALHTGSDFSYHAKAYALPYARIVGDAGCFIDPFFSSGVHLAVTGALSAGTTITASIRGDCSEASAAQWHSTKIRESYARFLMVVLSAYQQMRNQNQPVLTEVGEDNFDRAFRFFKPVIQGHADATKTFSQEELDKTIGFLTTALQPVFNPGPEETVDQADPNAVQARSDIAAEDIEAMKALTSHHIEDTSGVGRFTSDAIDGLLPRLERGNLTLVAAASA